MLFKKLLTTCALLGSTLAQQQLFLAREAEPEEAASDAPAFDWKEHIDDNKQPVIGIISQPLENSFKNEPAFAAYKSYIMVAYVNYMEAQGARVVPIINEEDANATLDKIHHVDGVLLPGGGGDYFDKGRFVLDEVKKINDAGQFYPLWGTCQGYEYLTAYTADMGMAALQSFNYHAVSLPLDFTVDPRKTKMYGGLGEEAMKFAHNNFTYNSHSLAVAPKTFADDKGLASFWDVTALSQMPNGTHFVASIEAKSYPVFATQFHPEKPSELWVDGYHINHSWESIQIQEHFSKLFVSMARANKNTYGAYADYLKHDISNYTILDTKGLGPVYVFE